MLLSIETWWADKDTFEKILWTIALLFSLLFILQTLLSFLGGGDGAEGHSDEATGGDEGIDYQFFTIRNAIAFFTMFGWTGIVCEAAGLSKPLTVILAAVAGAGLVTVMVVLLASAARMRASGTLQLKNAVNGAGETYLTIPAKRNGTGKIHIQIQGRLQELDALTDDEESISTGKMVRVLEVVNNRLLLVTAHK